MKVKILFDKDAKNKSFHIGWGISVLVDEKILFDTGESGHRLMENICLNRCLLQKPLTA